MLSVIIPMYNEENGCRKCIETLDAYLSGVFDKYEIVAVNDGSTDRTEERLGELKTEFENLRVCSYHENRGKGGAVREGVLNSAFDTVLYTDCDLAYGTKIIKSMYDEQKSSGKDIIIGSRNISGEGYEGYTFFRKIVSKAYIKVIGLAAGFKHSDSQCGIKCFGNCAKDIFSKCTVNGFAFDLEALMIGEKLGYSVGEYPVKILSHDQGRSKVRLLTDTVHMLKDLKDIKKRIKDISD